MRTPLAFGLGWGIAYGAWLQAPPMPAANAAVCALVICLAMWVAYTAGSSRHRVAATAVATATAVASAKATAQQAVVLNVNVDSGARTVGAKRWNGHDDLPWMVTDDRHPLEKRPELAEGFEPQELEDASHYGTLYDLEDLHYAHEEATDH